MKKLKICIIGLIGFSGSLGFAFDEGLYQGSEIGVPNGTCIASIGKATCWTGGDDTATCASNILVRDAQGSVFTVANGLSATSQFAPSAPNNPFSESTMIGTVARVIEWPFDEASHLAQEAVQPVVAKSKAKVAYKALLNSAEVASLKCN